MKGSILCAKCGRKMDEETGTCPKCYVVGTKKGLSCKISIYVKHREWVFRRGFQGQVFLYGPAVKYLKYLQQEIDRLGEDNFDLSIFEAKAVKDRIFETQWERFINDKRKLLKKDKRSPEYVRILESYNRKWYTPLHGKDVRDIKKSTIKSVHDAITTTKSKTVKNIMDGLRHFFRWMFENGTIDDVPPFPAVEVDDEEIRQSLSVETQAEQIALIPEAHRGIYIFETETGLRPGEACAVRIGDIDFENAVMLVHRTFSGQYDRSHTKQKKQHFLPLTTTALEIARKHSEDRLGKPEELYLFINPVTGRHYTRHFLGDLWNKHKTVDIRHYDATRHSFCTQLVDAGVNPLQAKDLMRHSTLKMTERYYHGNVNILRSALEKRTATVTPIKDAKKKVK